MMKQDDRKKIKQKLLTDLKQIQNEMCELSKQLEVVEPCCSLSDVRDEMLLEQNKLESIYTQAKNKFNRLKIALNSIDREDFGVCISCDEAINIERLMILPESQECVECLNKKSE